MHGIVYTTYFHIINTMHVCVEICAQKINHRLLSILYYAYDILFGMLCTGYYANNIMQYIH